MSACGCHCQSSPESCEALQLRLHELEAARGREMQAHGELVVRLERQVESRSAHQGDLQTALAKFTTDRVRLEAKHQALRTKWIQECAQHEGAKAGIARLREELLQQQEHTRQDLRVLSESNEQLQCRERELLVRQGVLQAQLDALKTDHQNVVATRESTLQALNSQTLENARLADTFKAKQLEAEALSVRVGLLSDELGRHHDANLQAQAELKLLERDCGRALQMRNRTLAWRKRQVDFCATRNFHHSLLLAWRSYMLHKQKRATRDLSTHLRAKSTNLSSVQAQVNEKLVETKAYLSQLRLEMANIPRQMALFRADVSESKLPQLLEQIRMNREQCAMAVVDSETRQLLSLEVTAARLESRKVILKTRQLATLALLHKSRKRGMRRQAFQGWKDVYLRKIVVQATHAAMLAQQQYQLLYCTAQVAPFAERRKSRNQQHKKLSNQQPQVLAQPSPYFTSLVQQQQLKDHFEKKRVNREAHNSDGDPGCASTSMATSLRVATSLLTTAAANATATADWKRCCCCCDAVYPVDTLQNREEDAWRARIAASLSLSPAFRTRFSSSLTTK